MRGARRNPTSRRWLAGILAALLCLPALSFASEEGSSFVEPSLSDFAIPYDETDPGYLEDEMLIAYSAILIEASSGNVIYEKNADQMMYPASTTKIMTALLTLQLGGYGVSAEDAATGEEQDPGGEEGDGDPPQQAEVTQAAGDPLKTDQVVTIGPNAVNYLASDEAKIPVSVGEQVPLDTLLTATMLVSGNDGAIALAEHVGGTQEFFVQLMNDTARYYGCTNTHFTNPTGLHDANHYTTARDMAIIAQQAMKQQRFRQIVSTAYYTMPSTNMHPQRNLINGNVLIRDREDPLTWYFPDAIGIKTGFHSQAGHCFVGAAERDGAELICVVFYTSRAGRWQDSIRLFEYGFSQYEGIDPLSVYDENPRVINISGFDPSGRLEDGSQDLGELELSIRAVDPSRDVYVVGTKDEIANYKRDFNRVSTINWIREQRAPVQEGEIMGILTFYPSEGEAAEYELIATRSIAARADAPPSIEEIERRTLESDSFWDTFHLEQYLAPIIWFVLIFGSLFTWLFVRHRRIKKRKASRVAQRKLPNPDDTSRRRFG